MTDCHSKHHLIQVHTPLLSHLNWRLGPVMYAIKIRNYNITKQHADAFQASFPQKCSLPARLVFLFCKVTCIILKSMSLFRVAQQFFNYFWKPHVQTNGVSSVAPAFHLSYHLTRPVRLPFTDTHSHLLAQLQPSNLSPHFTTRVTHMVNLSLSKHLNIRFFSAKTRRRSV